MNDSEPVTYWSKLSDFELVGKFLKCTKDVDGLDAECMYGDIVPVYSLNTLREWYGHNLEHKTPLSLEHMNIKLPDEIFFMKEVFTRWYEKEYLDDNGDDNKT